LVAFLLGNAMTCAILATGPSMSQAVADAVRGRCRVIVVSDNYKLAPWADALVSSDRGWWAIHNPEFVGRKFSGVPVSGIDRIERFQGNISGSNTGLIAIKVAVEVFKEEKVLLLGFDMKGSHWFGDHPAPLRNTKPARFEVFKRQFAEYRPNVVEIINCTPGSALTCYPMANLADVL
jgi:hypothetical protein